MKASGSINRNRQRVAQVRKNTEAHALPRRLSNLPPEIAKRAKEIMDLIVYGFLLDPEKQAVPMELDIETFED